MKTAFNLWSHLGAWGAGSKSTCPTWSKYSPRRKGFFLIILRTSCPVGNGTHFCDATKRHSPRQTPYKKGAIPLYHRSGDEPLDPTTLVKSRIRGGNGRVGSSRVHLSQVIYVWFDALLGYMSSLLEEDDPATLDSVLKRGWPAEVHVIGKDIMRRELDPEDRRTRLSEGRKNSQYRGYVCFIRVLSGCFVRLSMPKFDRFHSGIDFFFRKGRQLAVALVVDSLA